MLLSEMKVKVHLARSDWAEKAAGAGSGRVLGASGRDRIADRAIAGLVATDLSLPPEVPGFTPLVKRAMETVTIPAE